MIYDMRNTHWLGMWRRYPMEALWLFEAVGRLTDAELSRRGAMLTLPCGVARACRAEIARRARLEADS